MTLNQLSYYLAVRKHQNLTKAAAELSVSQPGLSAAITHTQNGLVFRKREKPGQSQQKRPGTWREAAEAVVNFTKDVKNGQNGLRQSIPCDLRRFSPIETERVRRKMWSSNRML